MAGDPQRMPDHDFLCQGPKPQNLDSELVLTADYLVVVRKIIEKILSRNLVGKAEADRYSSQHSILKHIKYSRKLQKEVCAKKLGKCPELKYDQGSATEMKELTSEACCLEAAELCKLNAIRLLSDSKNTSAPTKAALLELAIEECGKGLIVLLHLFRKNVMHSPIGPESRDIPVINKTKISAQKIVKAFPKEFYEMTSVETLKEAFYDHSVKLKAVSAIVEMLKEIAANPDSQAIIEFCENLERSDPNALKKLQSRPKLQDFRDNIEKMLTQKETLNIAFKQIYDDLNKINSDILYNLDNLKNNGLYVNYDIDLGSFLFPAGLSEADCNQLEDIVSYLIQAIEVFERIPQLFKGSGR